MSAIDWIFKLKRTWGLQWMAGWTWAKCPLTVNKQTTYWGYSRKVASLSWKSSPSYLIIHSYPNLLFCTEIFPLRVWEPLLCLLLQTAGDVLTWSSGKSSHLNVGKSPSQLHTQHTASCKYTGGINSSQYEAHWPGLLDEDHQSLSHPCYWLTAGTNSINT